jgi:hypothetical protein
MYNIVSYPHAILEQSWIKHLLGPVWNGFSISFRSRLESFCVKQDKTKRLHPESPLNRSCSHIGSRWDGAKNSGFAWFHLVLVGSIWSSVRSWFKKLYMWNCFAKISWSCKKSSQNFRWFKQFSFIPPPEFVSEPVCLAGASPMDHNRPQTSFSSGRGTNRAMYNDVPTTTSELLMDQSIIMVAACLH